MIQVAKGGMYLERGDLSAVKVISVGYRSRKTVRRNAMTFDPTPCWKSKGIIQRVTVAAKVKESKDSEVIEKDRGYRAYGL